METDVRTRVLNFIVDNYLFGDQSRTPADDEDLLLAGIVDSTGILEMIEFLESEFGIHVSDEETVPENLGSVANLTRYVAAKATG